MLSRFASTSACTSCLVIVGFSETTRAARSIAHCTEEPLFIARLSSIVPNTSRKKTGTISANSTAAEPRRSCAIDVVSSADTHVLRDHILRPEQDALIVRHCPDAVISEGQGAVRAVLRAATCHFGAIADARSMQLGVL